MTDQNLLLQENGYPNAPDIKALLREYAGNNGYSHGDYADTMTEAAKVIERLESESHVMGSAAEHDIRANNKLVDRIAELERELAEARKDAARLNWLESFHRLRADEGMSESYGDVGTNIVERTSDGWMLDCELDGNHPEFQSLRAAIDAAMKDKP